MSPVLNAGLNGMQMSYSKMTQAAQQIAHAGKPIEPQVLNDPQNELAKNEIPSSANIDIQSLAGSLVEMKQQQHVFTASAKVVSVANETLGSLIDDFL